MTQICANLEIALNFRCLTTAHILQVIASDIKTRREAGLYEFDGRHWILYPIDLVAASLPWVSERTIRYKIKGLVDAGILIVGPYRQDRKRWYALVEEKKMLSKLFGE